MVAIIVILAIMLLAFVNFTYVMYNGIENPTKVERFIIRAITSLFNFDWKNSIKALFLAALFLLFFSWLFCQIAGITLNIFR